MAVPELPRETNAPPIPNIPVDVAAPRQAADEGPRIALLSFLSLKFNLYLHPVEGDVADNGRQDDVAAPPSPPVLQAKSYECMEPFPLSTETSFGTARTSTLKRIRGYKPKETQRYLTPFIVQMPAPAPSTRSTSTRFTRDDNDRNALNLSRELHEVHFPNLSTLFEIDYLSALHLYLGTEVGQQIMADRLESLRLDSRRQHPRLHEEIEHWKVSQFKL